MTITTNKALERFVINCTIYHHTHTHTCIDMNINDITNLVYLFHTLWHYQLISHHWWWWRSFGRWTSNIL